MGLPTNERLRNLEQTVANAQQITYDGHPSEDQVLHGIVWKIESYNSSCHTSGACLVVCPFPPLEAKQNGALVFTNNETHPLANYSDDIQQIRVWVLNVDPAWLEVYYQRGDVIKYWRYNGTAEVVGSSGGGEDGSEEVVGSVELGSGDGSRGDPSYVGAINGAFVTLREDLSFLGEITYSGDDSTTHIHKYHFTAKAPSFATGDHNNDRWQTPHTCAVSSDLQGTAYNIADADGKIGPTVRKQITRIWPVLNNTDLTDTPFYEYWFDVEPPEIPVKITGSTQDGDNYRWTYTGLIQAKTGKKWSGWSAITGGTSVTCFNTIEVPNSDSGGFGNGVNSANLNGLTLQPIPAGTVVFCQPYFVPSSSSGSGSDASEEIIGSEEIGSGSGSGPAIEYWFSAVNQIDGTCST